MASPEKPGWGESSDATNRPTHVLARAISRLGLHNNDLFQQKDESGQYAYPSAMDLAKSVTSMNDSRPHDILKELAKTEAPLSGWTDKDVAAHGRDPRPFELSEAGKARDSYQQDLELLRSAMSANEQRRRSPLSLPAARAQQSLTSEAHRRAANEGRRYGESGWAGFFQNPEYAVGNLALGLQAYPDALASQAMDNAPDYRLGPVRDDGSQEKITGYHHPILGWVDDSSWNPMKGRSISESLLAAKDFVPGAVQKFLFHYLPAAADRRDALAAANRVERVLPAGADREEGNRLIEQTVKSAEPTFDDWYRMKFGRYPSYALSSAAVFANGFLDPSFLATGPAAKGSLMVGRAMNAAGKASSAGLVRKLLTRHGTRMAMASAPAAKLPMASVAASEAAEELPLNAAIMAALGLGGEAAAAAKMILNEDGSPVLHNGKPLYDRPHVPGWGPDKGASIFGEGQNRVDLLREAYDASGNFLGYQHEDDEAFAKRMQEDRERGKAIRTGAPGLMQQIGNSLHKRPAPMPAMIHAPF